LGNGHDPPPDPHPPDPHHDAPPLRERASPLRIAPWIDPNRQRTMDSGADGHLCVAPGEPTTGPNRLTIMVPTEATFLNIGQANGEPRFNERGIDGYTNNHIHFWTTRTVVMLGHQCHVLPGHVGYSMVTTDNAYHHADRQNCTISKTNEVLLRAASSKTAVLQSDRGTTEVAAGDAVTVTAKNRVFITAGTYSPTTTTYDVPWAKQSHQAGLTAALEHVGRLANISQMAVATVGGFAASLLRCLEGEAGTATILSAALGKLVANAAKTVAVGAGFVDSPNSIKVSGDRAVGLTAGKAELTGDKIAVVGTMGGASIIGATAEVKGWAMGGVWAGLAATLASKKIVKVSSPLGSVYFHAGGVASFASHKEMLIFGNDKVSMRSSISTAAVYGEHQAYVGAGDGYGVVVDHKKAALGKVANAKDFGHAHVELKHAVHVTKDKVMAQFGDDTMLHVSARKTVLLKADNDHFVKVSESGVHVKGKEIHIE
jgi:hypothetical protein